MLHIRSVYDIDGVDTAPGGIAAVRNPANRGLCQRALLASCGSKKLCRSPTMTCATFPVRPSARTGALGMRDILGYAPIEPDGSVKVKVPANVAFDISVLDANGRRLAGAIGSRHTNWLQVDSRRNARMQRLPQCANANPPRAHGRRGLLDFRECGRAHDRQRLSRTPTPRCSPTSAKRWRRFVTASCAAGPALPA